MRGTQRPGPEPGTASLDAGLRAKGLTAPRGALPWVLLPGFPLQAGGQAARDPQGSGGLDPPCPHWAPLKPSSRPRLGQGLAACCHDCHHVRAWACLLGKRKACAERSRGRPCASPVLGGRRRCRTKPEAVLDGPSPHCPWAPGAPERTGLRWHRRRPPAPAQSAFLFLQNTRSRLVKHSCSFKRSGKNSRL